MEQKLPLSPSRNWCFLKLVNKALGVALGIKDKHFRSQCSSTVGDWIIKKQDSIINNVKSPYQVNLKNCKLWPLPCNYNTSGAPTDSAHFVVVFVVVACRGRSGKTEETRGQTIHSGPTNH